MKALFFFVHLPFDVRIQVVFGLVLQVALLYILLFFPRRDSGFYSWHPVKRVLAIMFFPFVIFYFWCVSGCHCWNCRERENDTLFLFLDDDQ